MQPDSRRWVEVTPSEFAHERAGLAAVGDWLPDANPLLVVGMREPPVPTLSTRLKSGVSGC